MEQLSFQVADYEGPLDLLLQLVQKHKLNIYDIEISKLLDQYLEHIQVMQQVNLDLSSEFLEMASRLVYIKTVMLLPRHEEEAEQMRRELTGQLLEYQACQQAAQLLREREGGLDRITRPPMELERDPLYGNVHRPQELCKAYLQAVGRGKRRLPPPASTFAPIVTRRVVSVRSRVIYVLKRLYQQEHVPFEALFQEGEDRSELVATFLAVLELMKTGRILLDQQEMLHLVPGGGRGEVESMELSDLVDE